MRGVRIPKIQDNLIDKAIAYFSPVKATRRRHARMMLALSGGYDGGSKTRRGIKTHNPLGGSADADLFPDLATLRERSRDLVRNNPLAGGAIHTTVNSVVGTGLRLNARIDHEMLGLTEIEAKEFEKKAENGFRVWANECDIERQLDFYGQQELVFRSTLESGDCFVIMPYKRRSGNAFGLKTQIVEADRVSNPGNKQDTSTMRGGIELDDYGAPIKYHIMSQHPGDNGAIKRDWKPYEAYTKSGRKAVIHLYRRLRPGQHRGVPYLAPVIETIKQLGRYTEAEIMAAVISGMFTAFIKSESGEILSPMEPTNETGATSSDDDIKLGNGAIVGLGEGEDVTFANPMRPNSGFDPFVLAISRQIGVALELPYEILIKHFTRSYSAARASLLEAWRFFSSRRVWLERGFCAPVYEAWMTEAVARGYLYAPGFESDPILRQAYLGAEWIGPTQGQIDPVKEVTAAGKRLELKLTTRNEECIALTGRDWDTKIARIKQEEKILAEGGENEST